MKRTRISAALIATVAALAGCATEPAEAPPVQTTGSTATAPQPALPLSAAALAAYERGDHETAFREYSAFAEAGNATAQYGLGLMYARGEGAARHPGRIPGWDPGPDAARGGCGDRLFRGDSIAPRGGGGGGWCRALRSAVHRGP